MQQQPGVGSDMQFRGPRHDKASEFLGWRTRFLCDLLGGRMFARKHISIGLVWLAGVLSLLFVYPLFGEKVAEGIPYSFLLLAPFGMVSFPQWVLVAGVSYWAVQALGWNEPPIRKAAKWIGIGVVCVVALHTAWVLFVLAKGGL